MAERPVWKGQLRLSLVSIPVEMFSATNSRATVSFRQIHKPSGKPIQLQKVVPGVGPVKNEDIWKGYKDDGEYILIDPDEIDAIRLETKKTLELVQFVDVSEIPPIYFDKPYFLSPTDELAEDAFRVVRDALRQTGKAGIGQLAMRGREYLVAVRPCANGLLLETLHYEEEIRKTDPFFSSISKKSAEKDLLEVAKELISKKTAPFDAGAFEDHYMDAVRELVAEKAKGHKPKKASADDGGKSRGGSNVIDLMEALKKSVEKSGTAKKPSTRKASPAKSTPKKKSA
jgi:DNA end-binding protein Ku